MTRINPLLPDDGGLDELFSQDVNLVEDELDQLCTSFGVAENRPYMQNFLGMVASDCRVEVQLNDGGVL